MTMPHPLPWPSVLDPGFWPVWDMWTGITLNLSQTERAAGRVCLGLYKAVPAMRRDSGPSFSTPSH